jgi:Cu/Ag efflux pump CusA
VRVRYSRELRCDRESIRRIFVPAVSKEESMSAASVATLPASLQPRPAVRMARIPLAQVADIRFRPGPSMISSENGLLRERVVASDPRRKPQRNNRPRCEH